MKLVVDGVEYDGAAQPFIGDLRRLKKELGFGWGTVAKRLGALNEEADMLAVLDDEDVLEALLAWIWMARLRAGERDVTFADVELTAVDSIGFKNDPGDNDEAGDAAPTSARTDSAPGDESDAEQPNPKTSTKTSKKPSTRGSRS